MTNTRILSLAALGAGLAACGSDGGDATAEAFAFAIPRATCSLGDRPEVALQGQVPAAMRSDFSGFSCNLSLKGQYKGEGGNWSSASFFDGTRRCSYFATNYLTDLVGASHDRQEPGVPVVDLSDPTALVRTTSLTTAAMLDPWEGMRVTPRRKLLVAANAHNGSSPANDGGPEIDIYDLSADCRYPQLLSSLPVGDGSDGGIVALRKPTGHEATISADGLTYYIGSKGMYRAIDISQTTRPKMIAQFDMASDENPLRTRLNSSHGMSLNSDGTRLYAVSGYSPTDAELADPTFAKNGFVIFDTSEVQRRLPNPRLKVVSSVAYKDGSVAQHTLAIKIAGKEYVVMVDEGNPAGWNSTTSHKAAALGLVTFPLARIYDLSDERQPKLVYKFALETHWPENFSKVQPDIVGLDGFTYGSHYCSVDNRDNATAMACSYFNSGVRVFDIRNPNRPKEIAYYTPASTPTLAGSGKRNGATMNAGSVDVCASAAQFDHANATLGTMCQDSGYLLMQFAPDTWPFPESTPSEYQAN